MSSSSKKIHKPLSAEESSSVAEQENPDVDIDSAIFQLEMIHMELDKLDEKQNDEILVIEQRYEKLRADCFDKRRDVLENIADFWPNVFTSHPEICSILYEDEEDCLRYLQRVEVEKSGNIKAGYSIKLFFKENPYFKNEVLVKEFFMKQGNFTSISTKIDWKKPIGSSKEGSTKGGRKRPRAQQTFFGWFANNTNPTEDIIAEIIKDDIWPNALKYYLVPDSDGEGNFNKEDFSSDSSDSSGEGTSSR